MLFNKSFLLMLLAFFIIYSNDDQNGVRIAWNPISAIFDKSIDLNCEYFINPRNSIGLTPNVMFTKYSIKPGILFDYRFYFKNFEFIYLTEQFGLETVKLEYKESDGNSITRNESDAIYGFKISTGVGAMKQFEPGLSIGISASMAYLSKLTKPTQKFSEIMKTENLELSDLLSALSTQYYM